LAIKVARCVAPLPRSLASDMQKLNPKWILAALLAAAAVWGAYAWLERDPASEISPLGRQVLDDFPGSWRHLAGKHVLVHARNKNELVRAARLADFAYAEVGRRLELPDAPGKVHIYLLDRPAAWSNLLARSGLRPDGRALQLERDVFVLQTRSELDDDLQLAHEMVHLRLWPAYQRRVPLWLEEGLAGHLSWELVRGFHGEAREVIVRRAASRVDAIPLDELVNRREYPDDESYNRRFYQAAAAWVEILDAALDDRQWAELVRRAAGDGADWKTILREQFAYSDEQMLKLEQDYLRVR
jgi:hypothetical protein